MSSDNTSFRSAPTTLWTSVRAIRLMWCTLRICSSALLKIQEQAVWLCRQVWPAGLPVSSIPPLLHPIPVSFSPVLFTLGDLYHEPQLQAPYDDPHLMALTSLAAAVSKSLALSLARLGLARRGQGKPVPRNLQLPAEHSQGGILLGQEYGCFVLAEQPAALQGDGTVRHYRSWQWAQSLAIWQVLLLVSFAHPGTKAHFAPSLVVWGCSAFLPWDGSQTRNTTAPWERLLLCCPLASAKGENVRNFPTSSSAVGSPSELSRAGWDGQEPALVGLLLHHLLWGHLWQGLKKKHNKNTFRQNSLYAFVFFLFLVVPTDTIALGSVWGWCARDHLHGAGWDVLQVGGLPSAALLCSGGKLHCPPIPGKMLKKRGEKRSLAFAPHPSAIILHLPQHMGTICILPPMLRLESAANWNCWFSATASEFPSPLTWCCVSIPAHCWLFMDFLRKLHPKGIFPPVPLCHVTTCVISSEWTGLWYRQSLGKESMHALHSGTVLGWKKWNCAEAEGEGSAWALRERSTELLLPDLKSGGNGESLPSVCMYNNKKGKDKKSIEESIESILLEDLCLEHIIIRHRKSGHC